ncbi:MAG TPA: branched-chain amino acid ABC transporter permease [Bacillota bacterium]|nr:branched-chain amino acid ABC transporter permease [Bacillota bacterium]
MASFKQKLVYFLSAIALLMFPWFIQNDYWLRVAIMIGLYIILASSLNLINGYTGQFNIGHAGFYCIGAYTAAILATRYHFSFWLLLPLSGIVAALFSILIGLATLRLKGIYFSMTTLGFSEIIRLTVLNWASLTRGPMGIPGIPLPELFGFHLASNRHFYYIVLALTGIMLFLSKRVISSRIGRAWIAIREDEDAARAMGVETFRYKLYNLIFGTFWAGVAGCFYAFFTSFISADSFTLDEGFSILAMVLVGGQGNLIGPVIGAASLTILPEIFRNMAQLRLVIFGAAILIMIYLRPQGLAGSSILSQKYHYPKIQRHSPPKHQGQQEVSP